MRRPPDFATVKICAVFNLFHSGCVQLLQDTLGSTLILGGGSVELVGSGFRPTRQDVFEFIKQCGDITSTDPDEVSYLQAHAILLHKHPD